MFDQEFYPTDPTVVKRMVSGLDLSGKWVYEPQGGKGNIVDVLIDEGAKVISSEKNQELSKILGTKCRIISDDCFKVTSDMISHVDYIIMNPPFSNADKHILHMWDIAPAGCEIRALCNVSTVELINSSNRNLLKSIIDENGVYENYGDCFKQAERKTNVEVAMVTLKKPGQSYSSEFEGFFMDEDEEMQEIGLMSYNAVRDVVNRYVEAVKLFDRQLELGVQMSKLTGEFSTSEYGFYVTEKEKPITRDSFKKDLQKKGWNWIIGKMNLKKYATKGLKEDINTFVEKQTEIPFTMKNIYAMLELIVNTSEQRMDKALLEVFDRLTQYYDENRYNVEGWKTNSHYLMGKKFILPGMVDDPKWSWNTDTLSPGTWGNFELIEDLMKVICYLTGERYEDKRDLRQTVHQDKIPYGTWHDWEFFEIKGFKKGTMHFKFKSEEVWATVNQRVAKIKGYPLFEHV